MKEKTLEDIQEIINEKRSKLKPREIKRFPAGTRFLLWYSGIIPYLDK